MSDTPETDAARMKGYGEFSGDWCPLERHHYEKHPEGEVVFAEVAEKLERERDEFAIALRRIAGMHSFEKSTFQLACVANEMSCVAKVALIRKEEA